jgi:membrane protease YdiL (CAAX protease family)
VTDATDPNPAGNPPDAAVTAPRWTVWRLAGSVVLVAIVFVASQTAGVIAFGVVEALRNPAFDVGEWVQQGAENGGALVAATVSSTLICVPLVLALVGSKQNRWRFLRIQKTSARTLLFWCGVLIALVALSDGLTISMGRPVVPDQMVAAFSSAHPIWLFLALTLLAPLFEEIFFRGFLFSGLEAVGARAWVAVLTTAFLWSVIHFQYDLYGIVSIFVMGLILGTARRRTDSIVPCFAMHAVANAIAHFETAYRASSAQ